jgi:hypothetical protein
LVFSKQNEKAGITERIWSGVKIKAAAELQQLFESGIKVS